MANYRELLVKAVTALPENNGAARREVYEKARKALVAQLRSISPQLPAREITQHRLELEDCIRNVEQEATEKILVGLKQLDKEPIAPTPPPSAAPVAEPVATPQVAVSAAAAVAAPGVPTPTEHAGAAVNGAASVSEQENTSTIDAIIARADAARAEGAAHAAEQAAAQEVDPEPSEVLEPDEAAEPDIAPEPEIALEPEVAEPVVAQEKVTKSVVKPMVKKPRKPAVKAAVKPAAKSVAKTAEPSVASAVEKRPKATEVLETVAATETTDAIAHSELNADDGEALSRTAPPVAEAVAPVADEPAEQTHSTLESDAAISAAMSRVLDVEAATPAVDPTVVSAAAATTLAEAPTATSAATPTALSSDQADPQQVMDRALEALNREARGERDPGFDDEDGAETENGPDLEATDELAAGLGSLEDGRFVSGVEEEKGNGALTIFLVLTILLFGAVGGGGYWAWREGYVDLDALFAQAEVVDDGPVAEDVIAADTTGDETAGPGNTTTSPDEAIPIEQLPTLDDPAKSDERLPQSEEPVVETATDPIAAPEGDEDKVEDRLVAEDNTSAPTPTIDNNDVPAVAPSGARSLLLEASASGTTGAVPFSGTVEWDRGSDELGQPTLIGRANIPARNLSVEMLIRRNADPTLPASHLVEIQFETSDTFVGGSIASFGGILLKNEELVPGSPLIGAPARIFENMFLFALNSAEQDLRTNIPLLETNKWIDLALVYGTGRQAIITLEKDEAAEAMFSEVLAIWAEADS